MAPIKDLESLRQLIEEVGWADRVDQLLSFVKPSIAISTHRVGEQSLALGTSKIGGAPDLPYDIAWPEYRGNALDFVAQINLSDIREYDVEHLYPSTGIVYFFYDKRGLRQGWAKENEPYQTIYYNGDPKLLRRFEPPLTVGQKYTVCALTYEQELTFPPFESYEVGKLLGLSYENIGEPDYDKYWKIAEGFRRPGEKHRIGGYPDPQQADVFREAEYMVRHIPYGKLDYEQYGSEIQKWQLLMQIDSDGKAGMTWFDVGTLYFCIKRDAL